MQEDRDKNLIYKCEVIMDQYYEKQMPDGFNTDFIESMLEMLENGLTLTPAQKQAVENIYSKFVRE